MLPGKIFEYLASGRPVLGIGDEDGAAATVLRDSGSGVMYGWEEKERLMEFIDKPCRPTGNIDQYTRSGLTERLVALLENLIEK